jgi:Bacterial Ig-like domain (group 1)
VSPGNFSNNGVDTFDERKSYIGVRLQQGVPLLDRDWNELEDIRRYFERRIRQHYVGEGVPDLDGFEVRAPGFDADNDVLIAAGSCSVAGFDVWNHDDVLFSAQGDMKPLPAPNQASADTLVLYLEPDVVRVDATVDPDLQNALDVNMETCLRDQLRWAVRAVRLPTLPPPGTYVLAEITRQPGETQIRAEMISDRRRTMLNLANAIDRLHSAEGRLDALEQAIRQAQLDIEQMRQDLGRLFWDVRVESSQIEALLGARATIAVTVNDRNAEPVEGATLTFTTDWGFLTSSIAVTDANGKASVDLIGVRTENPVHLADAGLLHRVSQKVAAATLANPGAIEYAKVRFEPEELAIVSRYSPPGIFADLGTDLPIAPIVAPPEMRTATIAIYAKEGQGAIVRGVGSVQVRFGFWIRDWVRTKIIDVTKQVAVGARIGDVMRQGFGGEAFDHTRVTARLPRTLQSIHDETQQKLKENLFEDPELPDADVHGSGLLGQVIAQEATAAVGARTNNAITTQLAQFVATAELPLDEKQAEEAHTEIVQRSSQITAGFAQSHKQLFSVARTGG